MAIDIRRTWVSGQVPTEDDSVVVNGNVSVSAKTIATLTISSGAILENSSSLSGSLRVNGNITNNGTIKDGDGKGPFWVKISGDITNNRTWDNSHTIHDPHLPQRRVPYDRNTYLRRTQIY